MFKRAIKRVCVPYRHRARIVQSYSPDGANVHPHVIHGSLGSQKYVHQSARDQSSRFFTVHPCAEHAHPDVIP